MPTYEYMCKKCGPFTQLRPMAECELPSVNGYQDPRIDGGEVVTTMHGRVEGCL